MDNQQPPLNSYYNNIPQRRSKKPIVFFIAVIILVTALFYYFNPSHRIIISHAGSAAKVGHNSQPSQEELNPMPKPDPGRLNVLILGIRGEDDLKDGGLLTDTMLVASVNKTTGQVAMINVPRDLYVDMLGVKGKINEAYQDGYYHDNGKGIELVSELVSRITGIYIDKTVVFDFQAFSTIIDKLGGIDVHLDQPFSETEQWGYTFSLPAGNDHLTSEQALYYARSRYNSSDFDRSRRQQQIINAIKVKALTLGFLSNPANLTALIGSIKSHVKTNFQIWDLRDIISLASSLNDKTRVRSFIISTDNYLYQTHTTDGEYILLTKSGNYKDIQALFQNIFTTIPTFTPSPSVSRTVGVKK